MVGVRIYVSPLVDTNTIKIKLKDYSKTRLIEFEGEKITLLTNTKNFEIKGNRTIRFVFEWDDRISHIFRGETKFSQQTSSCEVRIIPFNNNLFYLIENRRGINTDHVARRLGDIIKEDSNFIGSAIISSRAIKEIEDIDLRDGFIEWTSRISDRDKAIGLFGNLASRQNNGTVSPSETHERYKDKPKSSTAFISLSIQASVYISKKKHSVSIRGGDINFDVLESYIHAFVLPRIILEALEE